MEQIISCTEESGFSLAQTWIQKMSPGLVFSAFKSWLHFLSVHAILCPVQS